MVGADEFGPTVHVTGFGEIVDRHCPAARPVRRFEDRDGITAIAQLIGGAQACEAGADDGNRFGGLLKLHDFGETADVLIGNHLLQGGERFGMESGRNRHALLFGRQCS